MEKAKKKKKNYINNRITKTNLTLYIRRKIYTKNLFGCMEQKYKQYLK